MQALEERISKDEEHKSVPPPNPPAQMGRAFSIV
jgi:hypothetical protein